jgi:two-component system OmpR family response regulator
MTTHLGPRAVPYLELLRQRGEPSESVRIRVALDVLGLLAGADASVRGSGSPGVDRVAITPDGRVELLDRGDGTGAAMLAWEVIAGRPGNTPPPRLHDVLDEVHPDVDAVIEQALRAGDDAGSVEQLAEDLAAAAQGRIATRERVTLELGTPPPRSAPPPSARSGRSAPPSARSRRSTPPSSVRGGRASGPPSARQAVAPPPPSAPSTPPAPTTPPAPPASVRAGPKAGPPSPSAPQAVAPPASTPHAATPSHDALTPPNDAVARDPIDDAWTTPRDSAPPPPSRRPSIHVPDDTFTSEEQERAAAIQRRAQERAAFVRDGARAVAARRLAAEYAAAERAAEEARLAERARIAEAEARAKAAERERDAASLAEAQALRRASDTAAQLLTGALDAAFTHTGKTVETPARSVLLIMPGSPERDQLSRALRDAGFGISVHDDARSALVAAPLIQPACIVADYDLPDSTGDAAARQLRTQRSELALTPFLLLAFHNEKRSGLSRFALGADVCMAKPFDADEVVGQVAALVNMAARLVSARRAFPTLEPGTGRGFGGDLIHMSIAAILTVVELERRTGTFHLTSDGRAAELEVVRGLLVSGSVSGLPMAPVGALRVMLAWRNGRFAFEPHPHRDAPEQAQSISDTLTAAMRYERAQPLQIERARENRPPESAPGALRLRPRDSKGR